MDYQKLLTEQVNPDTYDIDISSTEEIVKMINAEDKKIAFAVEKVLPQIARAVDMIVGRMKRGGRLLYIGAGTSGRLGVLDASECPPTYGVEPSKVVGIIAGGDDALRSAFEGVEDDREAGKAEIEKHAVGENDTLVGISASGTAPYVCAALQAAKEKGAGTIALSNTYFGALPDIADISIVAEVGPEVVMGSTRMKAGTSQKMVLNMLSTAAMIKLGKTYHNLMVDMVTLNVKSHDRAIRLVAEAVGIGRTEAEKYLSEAKGYVKKAIVMAASGCDSENAEKALEQSGAVVRKAIGLISGTQGE